MQTRNWLILIVLFSFIIENSSVFSQENTIGIRFMATKDSWFNNYKNFRKLETYNSDMGYGIGLSYSRNLNKNSSISIEPYFHKSNVSMVSFHLAIEDFNFIYLHKIKLSSFVIPIYFNRKIISGNKYSLSTSIRARRRFLNASSEIFLDNNFIGYGNLHTNRARGVYAFRLLMGRKLKNLDIALSPEFVGSNLPSKMILFNWFEPYLLDRDFRYYVNHLNFSLLLHYKF